MLVPYSAEKLLFAAVEKTISFILWTKTCHQEATGSLCARRQQRLRMAAALCSVGVRYSATADVCCSWVDRKHHRFLMHAGCLSNPGCAAQESILSSTPALLQYMDMLLG